MGKQIVKTTIELPDDLYRRAEARAALTSRRLDDMIEEGLRLVIEGKSARIEPADREEAAGATRRSAAIERLEVLMKSGRRSEDGWTFAGRRDALHDRSGG